jgi:hypothetical protein
MTTGQPIPLDHPARSPLDWPGAAQPHGTFNGLAGGAALGASATETGAEPRKEPAPSTTER